MGADGKVIGFVASPNRAGRTNQLVEAALNGAARGGAPTELIQALPLPENSANALGLARADALSAAGKSVDSLIEVTRVYEAGVKAFEAQQ